MSSRDTTRVEGVGVKEVSTDTIYSFPERNQKWNLDMYADQKAERKTEKVELFQKCGTQVARLWRIFAICDTFTSTFSCSAILSDLEHFTASHLTLPIFPGRPLFHA